LEIAADGASAVLEPALQTLGQRAAALVHDTSVAFTQADGSSTGRALDAYRTSRQLIADHTRIQISRLAHPGSTADWRGPYWLEVSTEMERIADDCGAIVEQAHQLASVAVPHWM
jgi:hypothetical protein